MNNRHDKKFRTKRATFDGFLWLLTQENRFIFKTKHSLDSLSRETEVFRSRFGGDFILSMGKQKL